LLVVGIGIVVVVVVVVVVGVGVGGCGRLVEARRGWGRKLTVLSNILRTVVGLAGRLGIAIVGCRVVVGCEHRIEVL
jgi:hypothetical protein